MPSPHHTTKSEIRQAAHAARRTLSDRAARSAAIARRLLALEEYQHAATVLLYVNVRSEVATVACFHDAFARGKQVSVPFCVDGALQLFRLKHLDELVPGAYGIPEPPAALRGDLARRVAPAQLDLILVPGVAFDVRGARCGHGRGYYDKLLADVGGGAALIAPAFDCQVFPEIPTEPHDVFMDKIVTESTIYQQA